MAGDEKDTRENKKEVVATDKNKKHAPDVVKKKGVLTLEDVLAAQKTRGKYHAGDN